MKQTQIEKVVAEMRAEKVVVDQCIVLVDGEAQHAGSSDALVAHSVMLGACIARLSSNGTSTPKPTRTRKSKKAETAL